jgi:hypothetical protein
MCSSGAFVRLVPLFPSLLLVLLVGGATSLGAQAAPADREPVRWAFIVGINDYIHFGDEPGGDLLGAVNDANNFRDVLIERWGFRSENVRILLDHAATRAAIRSGLTEWLPSVVKPGDQVVFFFAGHGSRIFGTDLDKNDGFRETISPADALRRSARNDIADVELGAWLRALPTDNVKAILDSCHSGSATRSMTSFSRTRSLARNPLTDLTPPAGWTAAAASRSLVGSSNTVINVGKVLEMAAARPQETSVETVFENPRGTGLPRAGGVFTTTLVRHLWQVPLETTYEEIYRLTLEDVKRQGFQQRPQLAGDARSYPLFGGPPATPRLTSGAGTQPRPAPPVGSTSGMDAPTAAEAFIPVIAVLPGGEVELGGGELAGVSAGSLYQVGSTVLRITRVHENRAQAERVEVATRNIRIAGRDSLQVGARAYLAAVPVAPGRLTVSLAPLPAAVRSVVAAELGRHPQIQARSDASRVSHLIVQPAAAGYEVLGRDGAVRHRIGAIHAAALASSLSPILLQEWGALEVAGLHNPAHPFQVEFGFRGERTEFRLDEAMSFRLRSTRAGYLTIVDLSTDGKVTVLFPNQYERNNFVRAGEEVMVPTSSMNFDLLASEPLGRGIVRAFVTAHPMQIPFAATDGFGQGQASQADAVTAALRRAAGEPPLPSSDVIPLHNWASASVIYEITR